MALKVLQVAGAAAVVVLTLFLIPVMIRLRRVLAEVDRTVSDVRPRALALLQDANGALDGINRELANIEEITGETQILIAKMGELSRKAESTVRSPLARIGLISAGVTATFIGVRRSLVRKYSEKG